VRKPLAKPDAECRKQHRNQSAVKLDGVLDDDEAVLGVLQRSDERPANKTKDEDMTLHDGLTQKYIRSLPRPVSHELC
jgi:hypothetical protein